MLKTILFTDKPTAERNAGQPDWAVISITGFAQSASLRDGWLDVLRLEFDDTDDKDTIFAFNVLLADQINRFVDKVKERGAAGILVHCHAGVSRSAAVAKWIARREGLPFNDRYELYNKLVYSVLWKHGNRDR
jgi:predicted protein tyrosine phosphatase